MLKAISDSKLLLFAYFLVHFSFQWFSSDVGIMDERKYLKITDRIKHMIIRGGENIFPTEIENFLMTHPKISEVQVL